MICGGVGTLIPLYSLWQAGAGRDIETYREESRESTVEPFLGQFDKYSECFLIANYQF
jgi:hypothetical protein